MKKYILFGMLAAILAGALVLAGCEGAATPSITNYYTGGPVDNNGLGDGDTLFLQNKPTLSYSTVTSLGALQLELFAPSLNGTIPVENIVYTGTGETLDYDITIPDGITLFIGYKTTNSPSEVLGRLTIGRNGSLTVGNNDASRYSVASKADAFLYIANGEDSVAKSAVILASGGMIVANGYTDTTDNWGVVRGALPIAGAALDADCHVIASDKWNDVNGFVSAASGNKVYYIGSENLTDTDSVSGDMEILTTAGNVVVNGASTIRSLTAATVVVLNTATLTVDALAAPTVTLGSTVGAAGTVLGRIPTATLTGDVTVAKGGSGTLGRISVSGDVTAWGSLTTSTGAVFVGKNILIDSGATVAAAAALNVAGSIYICAGLVTINGVGLTDGLNTIGTIYVNGGIVDFHDGFGGTPTADIVLKSAQGTTEASGYTRVTGATINSSAAVLTPRAVITTTTAGGGITVGAESTIGTSIWLGAGSYTAGGVTNVVTFTGGATGASVMITTGDILTIAERTSTSTDAVIKTTDSGNPVTTFGKGAYTNGASCPSGVAASGLVSIDATLTTTGTISTTLIDDEITTPTVPYGLTPTTLAKMRGNTGTVH